MQIHRLVALTTHSVIGTLAWAQDWNLPRQGSEPGPALADVAGCATTAGYAGRWSYNGQVWPGGVIPYHFEPDLTASERAAVTGAMGELQSRCLVQFVAWDGVSPARLTIGRYAADPNFAMSSHIGYTGGQQFVRIGNNLWNRRFLICHELMHAMHFIHEHARADRDTYVSVNMAAVRPGMEANFGPYDQPRSEEYDFASVMHYFQTEASAEGDRTVLVRPQWKRWWQYSIGSRERLSTGDIWGLTQSYGGTPPPRTFGFVSPGLGAAVGEEWAPAFSWEASDGAASYRLVVSTDPRFVSPVIDVTTTGNAYTHATPLEADRLYFWTVTATNAVGSTGLFPIPRGTLYTRGAYPAVVYVDATAPAGGDGLSWTTAFRDLQQALFVTDGASDAGADIEVRVAQGTYKADLGSGDRTAVFVIRNRTTLRGGFAGLAGADPDDRDIAAYASILSGDLAGNDGPGFTNRADNTFGVVVSLDGDGSSTLDGFTVRGGNGGAFPAFGSGVYIDGAGLTVSNCTITDCSGTTAGTCLFAYAGSPVMTGCVIAGNRADLAGTSPAGAGITTRYSAPLIQRSTITGNAALSGGGVLCRGGAPVFDNCLIERNQATGPGAAGGGAMLARLGAAPTLVNCTVAGNSSAATTLGGGIAVDGASSVQVLNSVVWGNGPTQVSGGVGFTSCIVQGGAAGVRVFAHDPGFVGAASGDYRLAPGSPAIDAGDNTLVTAGTVVDLDGQPRFHDDAGVPDLGIAGGAGGAAVVDLGACEFQGRSCGTADFDGDEDTGTDADIERFFACLAGDCCAACPPDADFNGDGDIGTDADIESFFRVLGGGAC